MIDFGWNSYKFKRSPIVYPLAYLVSILLLASYEPKFRWMIMAVAALGVGILIGRMM